MKSILLLSNVKNTTILEKSVLKCSPDDLFTFETDDVIPGKQATKHYKQLAECWMLTVGLDVTFLSYAERFQ